MNGTQTKRCAIYTRKSSENGLKQSFNSLHAQREACEAYIKSQTHEGWNLRPTAYDDGGISGGHMERPALHELIDDIRSDLVDVVVVYKVDRLSRSLTDFAQLVQLFDENSVSFVSITQHFNTSSSMGRLTLNVLLSFAQFEREVCSERIRDKIAASKAKGMWMGGVVPLGYDVIDRQLVANPSEVETVRHIYERYLNLRCVRKLKHELDCTGYVSKVRNHDQGGKPFSRGALYTLLRNPIYIGKIRHKEKVFEGEHKAVIGIQTWDHVQVQLEANRSKAKHRSTAKEPSLLAGLLFDDRGNALSPTHTTKGQKRYRYYINQALLKFEDRQLGSIKRLPAADIEKLVLKQIRDLLSDSPRIQSLVSERYHSVDNQQTLIARAEALSKRTLEFDNSELIKLLCQVVKRIEVSQNEVHTELYSNQLLRQLMPEEALTDSSSMTDGTIKLSANINLKKCGLETRLILGDKQDTPTHSTSLTAIQNAVKQAMKWNIALLSGKARTLTDLANTEGISQRYMSSLLPLAFLNPVVVEAIAAGRIPAGFTLNQMRKSVTLDWETTKKSFEN